MKRLALGSPPPGEPGFRSWAMGALREIERASAEDLEEILSEYSVTGTVTEARTFNAETADIEDIRNVLATIITDLRRRGSKRGYAE